MDNLSKVIQDPAMLLANKEAYVTLHNERLIPQKVYQTQVDILVKTGAE